MDYEEHFHESQEAFTRTNTKSNNANEKSVVKKVYLEVLSENTFFPLSHTLNYFADQIDHLLTVKGFKYILTGRMQNDPIEHRFITRLTLHPGLTITLLKERVIFK